MNDAGWDCGLATATHATPFQRPGWCTAWHASFGAGRLAPRRLLRDGTLAAVLPLVERPGGRLASPTNWHTPQFGLVAADEGARRALLRDVLAERPASLTLGFLDPETAAALAAVAGGAGYRFLERPLRARPCWRSARPGPSSRPASARTCAATCAGAGVASASTGP